jgi:DNA mismatch repair protein MutS
MNQAQPTATWRNVKSPTPMIAQYLEVKEGQQNALLFYRMGDFYEMFFEDAEIGANVLGITLTKRGKSDGDDIPMCGVPVHAVDGYLARLIKAGHRVALCEQVEDPATQKQRGGRGPLKRAVVRVFTPGTLTEDELLSPRQHNYLAAIGRSGETMAVAWADMSTGDFMVKEIPEVGLETLIAQLDPSELVVPNNFACPDWLDAAAVCLSEQAPALFDSTSGRQTLESFYQVGSLDGFGDFSRAMLSAAGALLGYLETTQIGNMPPLSRLQTIVDAAHMEIDPATRRSLELTRTLAGESRGSLLHAIDRTVTAAGGRLLAERLAAPLGNTESIIDRHELVAWFLQHMDMCEQIRVKMVGLSDMERIMARLSMGHGGPRDLSGLANGLASASEIVTIATNVRALTEPPQLRALFDAIMVPAPLADELGPALADDLPLLARDGGLVRRGYNLALDEIRDLRDESRRLIAALQQRYSAETNVASLKIKHNNVLGYHIDVRATHAEKLMQAEEFIHRQTTAQTVRFTTTELADMERDMASASERALAKELEIFEQLRSTVLQQAMAITKAAQALSVIDVAGASAVLAATTNQCRPDIRTTVDFYIEKGRHPVIESMLDVSTPFIPNDCDLGENNNLWLLTGPNMAGKSTFLRQNAHIAIMAQAGMYVPAETAVIGIVDRIFSRVGAADDLARGRSTFMVEMIETAAILNRATDRSLVILDEIGRGTATYDGLAIAWATLEHLHEASACRTLFATHYHELTSLQDRLQRLRSFSMQVREWQGSIIFLHQVVAGSADRSYGVHVARLAGLPASVLQRAEQILDELESGQHGAVDTKAMNESLPLFDRAATDGQEKAVSAAVPGKVIEALDEIHPDALTPREALELLYRLKEMRAANAGER